MNFINRLLENSRDEKFIHHLETIFGCLFRWYAIIRQIQQRNQTLLCPIDLLSKYSWVVPLKDKRGITVVNGF